MSHHADNSALSTFVVMVGIIVLVLLVPRVLAEISLNNASLRVYTDPEAAADSELAGALHKIGGTW